MGKPYAETLAEEFSITEIEAMRSAARAAFQTSPGDQVVYYEENGTRVRRQVNRMPAELLDDCRLALHLKEPSKYPYEANLTRATATFA